MNPNFLEVDKIIYMALSEDVGTGDITTLLTISPDSQSTAVIAAREAGVLAGVDVAARVFDAAAKCYCQTEPPAAGDMPPRAFGAHQTFRVTQKHGETPTVEASARAGEASAECDVTFTPKLRDGAVLSAGDIIAEISGPTRAILTGERLALNLMQRMSGIATKTAQMVRLVARTNAKIVDTRKTTPGLRILEKYAVRCGGGRNHRFGLYDAVLIKDNHIEAAGSVTEAVLRAKEGAPHTIKIEVETDTLEQVHEALAAGADMILLDNMDPSELAEAVAICKGKALTEASGGITEETVTRVAEAGVDLISVGALTHSVKSLDLGLDII